MRNWRQFTSNLFTRIPSGPVREAVQDVAQKLAELARRVPEGGAAEAATVAGRFLAYLNTSSSLPSASTALVALDTVSYDDTGEFDTGTSQFTAAEDSVWAFTGCMAWKNQPDGNRTIAYIYLNGTDEFRIGGDNASSPSGSVGRNSVTGSITLNLSAGDTVDLRSYTASGATADGGACYLYGVRIR